MRGVVAVADSVVNADGGGNIGVDVVVDMSTHRKAIKQSIHSLFLRVERNVDDFFVLLTKAE